jgi:hypothetical protein
LGNHTPEPVISLEQQKQNEKVDNPPLAACSLALALRASLFPLPTSEGNPPLLEIQVEKKERQEARRAGKVAAKAIKSP